MPDDAVDVSVTLSDKVLVPLESDIELAPAPRQFLEAEFKEVYRRDPAIYDYQRVDPGLPFKNMTGAYTRFGDVRALLAEVDDRFVTMARGDEVALEFDASALPPLPEGWARTLVLRSDGFCKDMDLYTAFPDTVDPLPYHGMEGYPPKEPSPAEAALDEIRRRWDTRWISGR